MKVVITDKNKIHYIEISDQIEENSFYTFRPTGFSEDVIVTIDGRTSIKVLKSNGIISVVENGKLVNQVDFTVGKHYIIKVKGYTHDMDVYTFPSVDNNIYKYDVGNINKITFGKEKNHNISFNDSNIIPNHLEISLINNRYYLKSAKETYLNDGIIKESYLTSGDIVFTCGVKIIWMNKFLVINSYDNKLFGISNLNKSPVSIVSTTYEDTEDNNFDTIYKNDDYFFHNPRLREIIEEKEFSIDPPPPVQDKEDMPLWLTLGTSLTMCASSFVMMFNVYNGLSSGTKTIFSLIPQIVMCVAMLVGGLIMPRVAAAYKRKKAKQREKLRQDKYGEYLLQCDRKITNILEEEKQILLTENIFIDTCNKIIENKNRLFWCRTIEEDDFLSTTLGIGTKKTSLVINAPEKHFSLDTDNLLEKVFEIVEGHKNIENVPIIYSFKENKLTSIISEFNYRQIFINNILLKLSTSHSPTDLKIILLTNNDNKYKWDYLRQLPHIFSEDKTMRFYGTTEEEKNDIMNYLDNVIKERKEITKKENDLKSILPYYLIVSDSYYDIKSYSVINEIISGKTNINFSLLLIDKNMKNIPPECEHFIELDKTSGVILEKNISNKLQIMFTPDISNKIDIKDYIRKLSNIPTITKDTEKILPISLSFLDMYNVSKIEQLNISNKWKNNNPVNSLSAPVGVHKSGEIFKLNLHEKEHGPHGLIAGSTGSGKSEFILTYILSMAINYHPYEVQFVLIDYKGGGLAGAFENKETGVKIPHLVGTITNLDLSEMNRTLVSINSEVKRRQMIFNEVRDSLGEGTIDIYKYQKLYREGLVSKPLAHLFIISDEFAELKSQQPQFMDELISVARIGRSLGVHLILATQKPSGVVNDQIWSNSKFKVCLKVQNKSDSMEMLKRPEAASLKEVGRFYLQVGFDEYFDIGQSGWAGAKYVPSDKIIKQFDNSVQFIDNTGNAFKVIKEVTKEQDNIDYGDQLTNIVKYIYELGKKENITTSTLWMPSIPPEIYVPNLKQKYNYKPMQYLVAPLIGEYDVPGEQKQILLTLDLTNLGNTVIYGQVGSGKDNLLTTIVASSVMEHTPDEVNFYIVDCGTEILKRFYSIPHVGEVLGIEDNEKIFALFDQIADEIETRKKSFMDYAGSYKEYITSSGKKLPLIVVIISSYEIFCENYLKLSDQIQTLYRDGAKYGIIFILSAVSTNAIRNRTIQYFKNLITLQLPTEFEYRSILNSPKGLTPANYIGRGLIKTEEETYEFQTAYICAKDNITQFIKNMSDQFNKAYTTKAKKILMIPQFITRDLLPNENITFNSIPVGFNISNKLPINFNFFQNKMLNILTNAMDDSKMSFIYALIDYLKQLNVEITIIDFVNAYERKETFINIINNNFQQNIINLNNSIIANKDNIPNNKVFIILGVGVVKSKLNEGYVIFENMFQIIKNIEKINSITIDTIVSFNNIKEEKFITDNTISNTGIWLGNNISNQRIFDINNMSRDDANLNFQDMAYFIENGEYKIVKHMLEGNN